MTAAVTSESASVPTVIDLDQAQIIHGDAQAALASLPDDSIDAIVTDPPYGLSKEPDITEVLTHWLNGDDYQHLGNGFMGNSWDSFVPGPSVWREAFRVLKPGGYGVVFASSRTIDLTMIALRMAGFEIRDTLFWAQAQGFPKSLDVGKALSKVGLDDLAKNYNGFGTALKPGHEPIALVRKPLIGTVANNVSRYGTGGLNIDGCRVQNTTGARSREGEDSSERRYTDRGGTNFAPKPGPRGGAPEGRFPANVVFTHAEECIEIGAVSAHGPFVDGPQPLGGGAGSEDASVAMTSEQVSFFDCVEGCPVAELDAQSGIRKSGKPGTYRGTPNRSAAYGAESRKAGQSMTGFGDSGGASRFYPTFKFTQKATSKERPTVWIPAPDCVKEGHSPDPHDPSTPWEAAASMQPAFCGVCTTVTGEGDDISRGPTPWVAYQHATVKPTALMAWLCRLVAGDGGTVLDLFAGTGSTGVAAVAEGFPVVLIERDPAHVAMIHKRMSGTAQPALFGV